MIYPVRRALRRISSVVKLHCVRVARCARARGCPINCVWYHCSDERIAQRRFETVAAAIGVVQVGDAARRQAAQDP